MPTFLWGPHPNARIELLNREKLLRGNGVERVEGRDRRMFRFMTQAGKTSDSSAQNFNTVER